MLGLDAVSLPFILDNRDRLPTLAALLDTGMLRELRSSAASLSASVWPTFSTGSQPGEHGQYFPFQWSAEHGRYLRIADPDWSEEFDCQPFWHRVARGRDPNHRLRHRSRPSRRTSALPADHQLVVPEQRRCQGLGPASPEGNPPSLRAQADRPRSSGPEIRPAMRSHTRSIDRRRASEGGRHALSDGEAMEPVRHRLVRSAPSGSQSLAGRRRFRLGSRAGRDACRVRRDRPATRPGPGGAREAGIGRPRSSCSACTAWSPTGRRTIS